MTRWVLISSWPKWKQTDKNKVWVIIRMEGKGADQVSCSPSHQLIKSIPTSSTKTATRKQTIPYAHYSFLTHRSTLRQPNSPLNTLPGFGKFGRGRTRTMEGNKMSSLVERQSLHTKSRPTVSIWGAIRDQLCFLGLQDPGHVEIACNKLAFPSDIKKSEFIESKFSRGHFPP